MGERQSGEAFKFISDNLMIICSSVDTRSWRVMQLIRFYAILANTRKINALVFSAVSVPTTRRAFACM